MYAVIEDSGTQIKVSEGDVIKVAVRDLADDQINLTFDRILLVGGNGSTKVGSPLVDGATVTADIMEEGRNDKIDIWKFRRRKNYVRHKGHRQDYIKVKVTAIHA